MRSPWSLGTKHVDSTQAFVILGLDNSASTQEVEERFRSLANDAHPDKGGSDQQMSELNEARATALKFLGDVNAMVPAEALQGALIAAQSHALARQHLSHKIAESRKEIRDRATNKLRKYRRASTILAAVCAGALFLGKEIPKEFFHTNISKTELRRMDVVMREEWQDYIEDRNTEYSRLWQMASFNFAICAGIGAWFFSFRIERAEHELKELEEQTSTKTLLYKYLQDIVPTKVSSFWTLEDIAQAIEEWPMESKQFKRLAREIGPLRFAQYLTDRALELDLIVSKELMVDGVLIEQYSIKAPDSA